MKFVLSLLACSVTMVSMAATSSWEVHPTGTKAQFRGLSVVSDKVAWAAGSMGTFGRMVDGGTWICSQIPGAEKLMFRSVAGFGADHAVLLAIGPGDGSRILSTQDGGKTWKERWVNPDPKAFFDSLAFWDHRHGIAFSDPVNGHMPLISTDDGGLTWKPVPNPSMPEALTGEGAFSASGTCVVVSGKSDVWIATGGAAVSRVFHSHDRGSTWSVAKTPIPAGKETSGIFGLRFIDAKTGIAVGGDYKDVEKGGEQVAITNDGGASWNFASRIFPTGLREAVAYVGHKIVVVGPSGSDYSDDGGRSWLPITDTPGGLHACEFHGAFGWAAGDNGLIAKWRSN